MVWIKILEFNQKGSSNSILLKVLAGEPEFRQLLGYTDHICMFATHTVDEPVKITKTGARHSFAKWFLLPAKLRVEFGADEYDFNSAKAGAIRYKEGLFFIYRVDRKGIDSSAEEAKGK